MSGFVHGAGARCDLRWVNNRVSYDGRPVWYLDKMRTEQGGFSISIDEQGCIHWQEENIPTPFFPNAQSIALDTEQKILYFAAQSVMVAYDLVRHKVVFQYTVQGLAGAPTLVDWLLPDASVCRAVGFSDGVDAYIVLDRTTGAAIWRTSILSAAADAAAHWNGHLFLVTQARPMIVFCLDVQSGELIWWNRGSGEAVCGMVCGRQYCVLCTDGRVEHYALSDGERS